MKNGEFIEKLTKLVEEFNKSQDSHLTDIDVELGEIWMSMPKGKPDIVEYKFKIKVK